MIRLLSVFSNYFFYLLLGLTNLKTNRFHVHETFWSCFIDSNFLLLSIISTAAVQFHIYDPKRAEITQRMVCDNHDNNGTILHPTQCCFSTYVPNILQQKIPVFLSLFCNMCRNQCVDNITSLRRRAGKIQCDKQHLWTYVIGLTRWRVRSDTEDDVIP